MLWCRTELPASGFPKLTCTLALNFLHPCAAQNALPELRAELSSRPTAKLKTVLLVPGPVFVACSALGFYGFWNLKLGRFLVRVISWFDCLGVNVGICSKLQAGRAFKRWAVSVSTSL